MTPAQKLLAALRARGVELRAERDCLIADPGSAITAEHRVLLGQHAEDLVALLRAPRQRDEVVIALESDAILSQQAEAEERARAATMAEPPPAVMFRTRNGWLPLRALDAATVRRFEAAGKMTAADVREWARSRRRVVLW